MYHADLCHHELIHSILPHRYQRCRIAGISSRDYFCIHIPVGVVSFNHDAVNPVISCMCCLQLQLLALLEKFHFSVYVRISSGQRYRHVIVCCDLQVSGEHSRSKKFFQPVFKTCRIIYAVMVLAGIEKSMFKSTCHVMCRSSLLTPADCLRKSAGSSFLHIHKFPEPLSSVGPV